ncbi:MAG: hypothetical protein Q8M07_01645 [Prosthecobacter sp.]|nr:hypothetical protein [Prosthecobacter sp.]
MQSIMIGAISLAAVGFMASACTTHETRIVQAPAVLGAAPGSTTTTIRTESSAPIVIESEEQRDIIVKID